MKDIEWMDGNRIKINPPAKTKKITGTRFASILGKNVWSTPFEMWCAITKIYEKPFEDSIYTKAGKVIEPMQADYMKNSYGMNIVTPTDLYGADYFEKTWGDFFPETPHFGGMWDYLSTDENGNTEAVLEMKTTKRAEDWKDDVPEHYALQAALYAYLLGVDDVIMVASFLEDKDYEHPENFKVSADNTITIPFKVSERYPLFSKLIEETEKWWDLHVTTGLSPVYDEKKDADILKALRTNTLSPSTDIDELIKEGETLKAELDIISKQNAEKEKRLKVINDMLKEKAISEFKDGDKKVEIKGDTYTWTVSKSDITTINKDALKKDGLLDKYSKTTQQYRMTVK